MLLIDKVKHLLYHSKVTGYRIHKDTHVNQSSIVKYRRKVASVENMPIRIAEQLGIYDDKIRKRK